MVKPQSGLTREEKLAQKLRENLKRRKSQTKKRAQETNTGNEKG